MLRIMLKSKIHRLKVTSVNLYYHGSITIDKRLMEAADILEGEKVEVLNLNNGVRLETYAIKGKPGVVCLNGPAARSACVGDQIIVLCYCLAQDNEAKGIRPKVVHVDGKNRITH